MALLNEVTLYRENIMRLLCSNEEIVKLLTYEENPTVLPNRDLMYTKIFPYGYNPDTVKETDTFICFTVGIPEVYNKTYKEINVIFFIFSHQSLIRTSHGLRTDLIGAEIDKMFNGNIDLGVGRLNLQNVEDISPAVKYNGIAISYNVTDWNRPTINGKYGGTG